MSDQIKTETENEAPISPSLLNDGLGYWCVICKKKLDADDMGVIVHDNVPHPENMTFNEEEMPQ